MKKIMKTSKKLKMKCIIHNKFQKNLKNLKINIKKYEIKMNNLKKK